MLCCALHAPTAPFVSTSFAGRIIDYRLGFTRIDTIATVVLSCRPSSEYQHISILTKHGISSCVFFLFRRRRAEDIGGAGGGSDAIGLTLWEMGAAGLFSGTVTAPLRTAFERVKTVMQVTTPVFVANGVMS